MSTQRGAPAHPRRPAAGRQRRDLFLLGGFALMVLLLLGSVALVGRPGAGGADGAAVAISDRPAPPNAEPRGHAWGPQDAPIQVIEYADYECESCGYFAQQLEADVVAAFAHTGKVRFEVRNAPFHGQGARNAAAGAYCAAEQDAFWPMHDSLFLNQPAHAEGAGLRAFSEARLTAIAGRLGLDAGAFQQCLASGRYAQQVEDDYAEAVSQNITGTPTFVVNGQMFLGPQSAEDFRRIFAEVAPAVRLEP